MRSSATSIHAKARNFKSALEGAMFPDNVPVAVYDNLIASIHRQLPALHHYYDVRRRKMGLKDDPPLRHLRADPVAASAIAPHLGRGGQDRSSPPWPRWEASIATTIGAGLRGRWCDRYENRGKQSGAFSQGCFDGEPVHPDQLSSPTCSNRCSRWPTRAAIRCTATFSHKTQPYAYYEYTLFRGRGGQHLQRNAAEPVLCLEQRPR